MCFPTVGSRRREEPTSEREMMKVEEARKIRERKGFDFVIEIDGGITPETLPAALKAGVQVFVTAYAVFKNPAGIAAGIRALRNCLPESG